MAKRATKAGKKKRAANRSAAKPRASKKSAAKSAGTKRKATRAKKGAAPARASGEEREDGGGPRPLWSGTVTFGLVSVPVDLFPAARDAGPRVRLLSPDGKPLERRYRCPEHDRDVPWDEVARADETDDGPIQLADEEIEAIAPRRSRDIEIQAFVDADEIDPTMTETAYVLTPAGGSSKPYRLLADAMESAARAGVGAFVLRRRERLVAVTARSGVLWAVALRFRGELRGADEIGLDADAKPDADACSAFRASLKRLANDRWTPDALKDERVEALRALVAKKRRRGEDVVEAEEPEDGAPAEAASAGEAGDASAPDLLAAIRSRLESAGAGSRGRKKAGSKKRTAQAR